MLVSRLWLDSILRLTVVLYLYTTNRDFCAVVRLIKALRLALRLALHRTIGSVSVQSIEALGAVLIVQLHRRIPEAV